MANVVFGAGGATGYQCVLRLLETSTLPVRAVVRSPEKYAGTFPADPKLQLVPGDVTDPGSCSEACRGASGVIFAASGKGYWSAQDVDYKGVSNVAQAAKAGGANRVVLVSSMQVTDKNWWSPIRLMLNNIRYKLMDYKFMGEQELRKSGLSYTIVRPGGLTNGPGGQSEIVGGQGDNGIPASRSISRADVAAVCVDALTNPKADRVTLECVAVPGALQGSLASHLAGLWQGLTPDSK